MMKPSYILHIAIDTPLRHSFDYLPAKDYPPTSLQPGMRVQVPFGSKQRIGLLLAISKESHITQHKLKAATRVLDIQPLLPASLLALNQWASAYYQHPIGEVMLGTLPQLLRQGHATELPSQAIWQLTIIGFQLKAEQFQRAPQQAKLWQLLKQHAGGLNKAQILEAGCTSAAFSALRQKGYIHAITTVTQPIQPLPLPGLTLPELNSDQHHAVITINSCQNYQTFLLDGVTGSGKTEVYLRTIAQTLSNGKQALILVPEIGLTPQTVARFQERFINVPIAVFHSGLSERERLHAWLSASKGESRIIIGTRSAIFTPLAHPGIIIIDEEHDLSFKQQTGFRYSARDLAIMRGKLENIPVILGSATPSLESVNNVLNNRFIKLALPKRVGSALQPSFHIIDLRNQYLDEGLSPLLLQAIKQHLSENSQVLLFINRRGFAPVLLCHACGWSANCKRCDARLTIHTKPQYLLCHHCGSTQSLYPACPTCRSTALIQLGIGTERLENTLSKHFPKIEIARIDRDSTRRKGAMQKLLTDIHSGHSQILIGTQMLAKGHHFPNVTLVGIIDADSGLYSTDFRASERMAQLIIQVSGRAGRAEKPGQVFLQTHNPDHPQLQQLISQGYAQFSESLLVERRATHWPPYSALALLRAEAVSAQLPLTFLNEARQIAQRHGHQKIHLLGPIPAPMERKAGRFRALFLMQSSHRQTLQNWLPQFLAKIEQLKSARKVRWAIDVDPLEMY